MPHSSDSSAIGTESSRSPDPESESISSSTGRNRPLGINQVWAVAQSEHPESRTAPSWILNAAARIVERYSPPGGRILILASSIPARAGKPVVPHDDEAARRRGRQMIPLMEIAAVGARLGRRLEVRLHDEVESGPQSVAAWADRDSRPAPAPGAATPPESASGLPTGQPPTVPHEPADSSPVERSDFSDENSDRFDAVIVLAHTPAPEVVPAVAWSQLLDRDGVLAVITHGYASESGAKSPGTLLRRSVAAAGLVEIDRLPLLEVPIRRGTLVVERPVGFADHNGPPWPRWYADLFLFAMPGGREARETGADR